MHPLCPPFTAIFAGGGTGGHIYPALAIAHALRVLSSDITPRFLVSDRPLDARILSSERLDSEPVSFSSLPAKPFSPRPLALARFLHSWAPSVRTVRAEIQAAARRGPVVLIALGGFVAAPAVQAARAQRIPRLLINLDAVPGKANRWIARHCHRILTAAPLAPHLGAHPHSVWQSIPPIVRPLAVSTASPHDARRDFNLDPNTRTLLITGGSQGAGSIDAFLMHMAALPSHPLQGWQVIHQTGKETLEAARNAYTAAGIAAWVNDFIPNMGQAWRAADLALCRAGAGNVAEAWANAVPALFMPYPFHRDQHQRHNARILIDRGGALLTTDHIDPAANLANAGHTLQALLSDFPRLAAMRHAMQTLGPADGAHHAANAVIALASV